MSDTDRDAILREHKPLIIAIARRVRREMGNHVPVEDLEAFGIQGLLEAHSRFDPSRGARFATFAYYRIRGAMLDGVRKMVDAPPKSMLRTKRQHAADDIAEHAGFERGANVSGRTPEQSAEAIQRTLARLTTSFVASCVDADPDDMVAPDAPLLRREQRDVLRAALTQLPERERFILVGYYLEERPLDEVAQGLGLSISWASRLHHKGLDRLRELLAEIR
ncbi:MAG: sigma-70 family RNA polymerase sigma factor [Polyangiales bacterium]|nr:sigma-70 family RNA polymerase sigma factor [Myxococcales bacterium]MCB9658821.1 sigma-70 family RNA polymerase sigma factor [Sandaracinaceae bacterium]